MLLFGLLIPGAVVLSNNNLLHAASCAGVSTSVISCEDKSECADGTVINTEDVCPDGSIPSILVAENGIWALINVVLNIMTAGVGILAVGGLVYGGILYSTAEGVPEKSKKAKTIIGNVAVGLIMYMLMYSLLQFFIPGGLFS